MCNPTVLFFLAREHNKVGIKATDEYHKMIKEEDVDLTNMLPYAAVAATNISFALEICLKGLHLFHFKKFPETHSLFSLFFTLPEQEFIDIQKQPFINEYEEYVTIGISDIQVGDDLLKYETGGIDEIMGNLTLHDNSFIEFRYLFDVYEREEPMFFNFRFMATLTMHCLNALFQKLNIAIPIDNSLFLSLWSLFIIIYLL